MIIGDAHQSGFHGVSQKQWDNMLDNLAGHANVGVVTESVGFAAHLEGWLTIGRETKVVCDGTVWEAESHGTESIPTPQWTRGTARRTTVEVTWALLVHRKTRLRLLRLGGHLPAHLIKPSQKRANQAALDGLPGIVTELRAAHTPDLTAASFDFNRNLKLRKQRQVIRDAMAGTGLRIVVPPKATHDVRAIDGFLTDGDLPACSMMARCTRFDHRGVAMRSAGCPA